MALSMGGGTSLEGLSLVLIYLVDGQQGGGMPSMVGSTKTKGLVARETTAAPILLRALFKGSEVMKRSIKEAFCGGFLR